jgi:uncharacterized protein (TIGR02246 family)
MNKAEIEKLHATLLNSWNNRNAHGMASLFCEGGNVIGFDGSQMNGQLQIESALEKVFVDHQTAAYVWKVEEVRFLSPQIALLRAIVGMIPPGKKEINPPTNAIQSLVAIFENNAWKIALFQNTPAQFHGRPELVERMTVELNKLIERQD